MKDPIYFRAMIYEDTYVSFSLQAHQIQGVPPIQT